jgi:hypothetical protein
MRGSVVLYKFTDISGKTHPNLQGVQTDSGAHAASYPMGIGGSFSEG